MLPLSLCQVIVLKPENKQINFWKIANKAVGDAPELEPVD